MKITAYNLSTRKYQNAEIISTNNGFMAVDFGDGSYQRVIENPMTEKQHDFLTLLGVDITGYETLLDKKSASNLIDAAKAGEVEDFGFEMLHPVVTFGETY
jgi:hypothetical protein